MKNLRGFMKGGIHRTWALTALVVMSWLFSGSSARALLTFAVPPEVKKVKVSIVVIIASEKSKFIEKRLSCVAREVQKLHPKYTGFRISRTLCKSLPVKGSETFDLWIDQKAKITVLKEIDENKRIQLRIKPPTLGAITYTTCCGKFFPIITRYHPKKHELLIIAICVHTCNKKKK